MALADGWMFSYANRIGILLGLRVSYLMILQAILHLAVYRGNHLGRFLEKCCNLLVPPTCSNTASRLAPAILVLHSFEFSVW